MRLRAQSEYELVVALINEGRGDTEIARLTALPRRTINGWRRGRGVVYHQRLGSANSRWRPETPELYCYLLGVYLGDGCVSVSARGAASLAVYLDSSYPEIVSEVERSMRVVFLGTRVRRFLRAEGGMTGLKLSHPALPFAFPQHGEGQKHTRRIELRDWQASLTRASPKPFLRGLIHSDGCRCLNRFSTKLPSGRVAVYEYPRYFFSNLSEDIRRIFCEHCELLGIRWTQSNPRNISVSYRHSVKLLDEFVGPKT